MSQVDTAQVTFPVSAALPARTAVELNSSGKLIAAVTTNKIIGFTRRQTFAADEQVAVDLLNKEGTQEAIAAGAIAIGDIVVPDTGNAGQLAMHASSGVGIAKTAATEQGQRFEFIPCPQLTDTTS